MHMKKIKRIHLINKKALFDKSVDVDFKCGMALKGFEVKSIRSGKCNLNSISVFFIKESPYITGSLFDRYVPLLMKKNEIARCLSNKKPFLATEIIENDKGIFKIKIAQFSILNKQDKRRKLIDKILNKEKHELRI